ncbi:hypothetical protein NP493_1859g00016 [Ridgeia piscesae]|uniref:Uncharacterized protein n=1 Tax=Ridgeia piscesae TaxID=27915 RepID=A0AAD9N5M1_RIDPI|nr:hypothetical protein NP493_1859g00016 [Ridgeia piscesae]
MGSDRCLGTVGVAESVGVFLRGTSHLRELRLSFCGLTPHSLTTLMTHMTGACLQLEVFQNDHSPCLDTETAAQSLCDCLRQWTRLRRLHLWSCRLTSQTLDVVSTEIRQCHELQEFICFDNKLDGDNVEDTFRGLLRDCSQLRIKALNCGLSDSTVDRLEKEFGRRFSNQEDGEEEEEDGKEEEDTDIDCLQ